MEKKSEPQPKSFASYLPILGWLPHYDRRWLRADLVAGLTALLIPEWMAYARSLECRLKPHSMQSRLAC
jgi:MFS superfamily sulfate permease-like transporter